MKHTIITLHIFLMSLLFSTYCSGQVYFKLSQSEDEKTYIVSMIPEVSLESPMNMVSTSQVTLRIPANKNFVVNNLTTDLEGVRWQESYVAESPKEAPGYEYISFGLSSLASRSFSFNVGEEVELFRFENLGECPGLVSLVDNEQDEFVYPNSKSVSISNGITVLGLGTGAYYGNIEAGSVGCASLVNKEVEILDLEASVSLSPNPTSDFLKVEFSNPEDFKKQELKIYNLEGQMVHSQSVERSSGLHNADINVKNWNSGSYLIYIENDKGITKGNRFVKVGAF